jgi:hypothetical protein
MLKEPERSNVVQIKRLNSEQDKNLRKECGSFGAEDPEGGGGGQILKEHCARKTLNLQEY